MRYTIKMKLYIAFGFVIAFLIGMGIYSTYVLAEINSKTTEITTNYMTRLDLLHRMNTLQSDLRIKELGYIVSKTPAERAGFGKNVTDLTARFEALLADYDKVVVNENRQILNAIINDAVTYKQHSKDIIALTDQNKPDDAYRILSMESRPLYEKMAADFEKLIANNKKFADAAVAQSEAAYNSSKFILMMIIVVAFLLSTVIAYYISRNIKLSINELLRVSEKVADGDLRVNGKIISDDELGTLTVAYNKTIDNLKKLIYQIQNMAEQVAASSEELTASADQSSQVTQQIAQNIGQVASSSDEQLSIVNTAAGALQNVAKEISAADSNADISVGHAEKAANRAKEGSTSIDKAITQMATIESTVNSSAVVVTKLGERSKEIGQIVETISGIAGQTNLLALNAAIEAARAGEQGRGFAVVAEEVRKLAEQSQVAAERIATLIADIQSETGQAVLAMDAGTKEVKIGTSVVNEAGLAFREIAEMAVNLSTQVQGISGSMKLVSGGNAEVLTAAQGIETASKNVSSEAQTVAAATQEQSAAMEQIAASSQALAKLAQEMQGAVGRFNV